MLVTLLDLVAGNLAVQELSQVLRVEIDVVRMRHRSKRRGPELFFGVASDPTERIVDLQPAIIHGDERHADRRIVECALEALPHLIKHSDARIVMLSSVNWTVPR